MLVKKKSTDIKHKYQQNIPSIFNNFLVVDFNLWNGHLVFIKKAGNQKSYQVYIAGPYFDVLRIEKIDLMIKHSH